jgi:hypothetical protein
MLPSGDPEPIDALQFDFPEQELGFLLVQAEAVANPLGKLVFPYVFQKVVLVNKLLQFVVKKTFCHVITY